MKKEMASFSHDAISFLFRCCESILSYIFPQNCLLFPVFEDYSLHNALTFIGSNDQQI